MSSEAPADDEVAARVRAAVAGDFQPDRVNGFPMRPDEGSIDLVSSSPCHHLCRCFPPGGSHQRVNLYACSLSQMVMQEDTKIYPGSGKRRPYVQRGREVCIILHQSACIGVDTSVV